jgi:hypothetical protein
MDRNVKEDQPIINRKEKRAIIHNYNRNKGLQKKHTLGAFGQLPSYLKPEPQDVVEEVNKPYKIAVIPPEKEDKQ